MDRNLLFRQINYLLETITEQTSKISRHSGNVPQLEIDLVMSNVKELYQRYHELSMSVNAASAISPSMEKTAKPAEEAKPAAVAPVVKESIIHSVISEKEELPEPPQHAGEVIIAEAALDMSPAEHQKNTVLAEKPVSVSPNRKKSSGTLFEDIPTVGDKYESKESLHDRISKTKEDLSLGTKLKKQPVKDLKKAIGINEKFLFVNELFDGNVGDYNAALDHLNNCTTLDEADKYLKENLSGKFSWDSESTHVREFFYIVERRFML